MSKVKIISDSTCDLSEELLIQYDIAVLPHPIVRDGELLQDNVSITPDDIYAHYERTGRLCTTSAPNAYDYEQFWRPWLDEGYEIVHFTISSEMSTAYNQAVLAAEETGHVYPVDSRSLSTGIGLLVLEACDLRDQGFAAEEIAARVREDSAKCQASFLVDVIEYLWKGGRCSSVAAIGANLLKLKPRIDVQNGKMLSTKKYRGKTTKCFAAYADDLLKGKDNIRQNRIFITHSGIDEDIIQLVQDKIRQWQPGVEHIYVTRAGGTISCHCGPGTLGILYMYE
jgi:DegV family protein with EDD domain